MTLAALDLPSLLLPHLRGSGRVSPPALSGAVLAVWAVVIDRWPTGWVQVPRILPNAAALRLPSFRQASRASPRTGRCGTPPPGNPR